MRSNSKRSQTKNLDELPMPDRSLLRKYKGRYFFTAVRPMASIFTSRGCSFDCNFCAIWEFYERRTRYLSAEKIVDQMEACEERFVFVLDENDCALLFTALKLIGSVALGPMLTHAVPWQYSMVLLVFE